MGSFIIAAISIFVLCALFGGAIVDSFGKIIGIILIIASYCLVGGAIGWGLFFLCTHSMATSVLGFVIGCVVGFIWFFVQESY